MTQGRNHLPDSVAVSRGLGSLSHLVAQPGAWLSPAARKAAITLPFRCRYGIVHETACTSRDVRT